MVTEKTPGAFPYPLRKRQKQLARCFQYLIDATPKNRPRHTPDTPRKGKTPCKPHERDAKLASWPNLPPY